MDLKAVGLRIKAAREAKNLTQENLAALVDLSPTHISVIERGLKTVRLDKFVAIANALDVSADYLLVDVVAHSVQGLMNELSEEIHKLPLDEQKRLIKAIKAYVGSSIFVEFYRISSYEKILFSSFHVVYCSKERQIILMR